MRNAHTRKYSFTCLILIVLMMAVPYDGSAQLLRKNNSDSTKKASVLALPFAYYSPETRWGFGAFGMVNFFMDKDDSESPSSLIQFGGAYTQNKQILLYAPFNLFWKEGDWRANGEVGYYKFSYNFYGVGNDIHNDFIEKYEVNFPRIRVHINKRIKPNWFLGGQYWFESMELNTDTFDPEGLLYTETVPGSKGGRAAGVGLLLTYDSRDHVHYPTKGWFVKGTIHTNSDITLSEYNFDRYRLDVRKYLSVNEKHVFAGQVFLDHITGAPPFSQMAFFGGTKRARGYYTGRYRDKNMLLGQIEYRTSIWRNFGAVVFYDYGMVSSVLNDLSTSNGHYSYGIGLRYAYDPKKKVNVRFDAAFGPGISGYYFTFGEAF